MCIPKILSLETTDNFSLFKVNRSVFLFKWLLFWGVVSNITFVLAVFISIPFYLHQVESSCNAAYSCFSINVCALPVQ